MTGRVVALSVLVFVALACGSDPEASNSTAAQSTAPNSANSAQEDAFGPTVDCPHYNGKCADGFADGFGPIPHPHEMMGLSVPNDLAGSISQDVYVGASSDEVASSWAGILEAVGVLVEDPGDNTPGRHSWSLDLGDGGTKIHVVIQPFDGNTEPFEGDVFTLIRLSRSPG